MRAEGAKVERELGDEFCIGEMGFDGYDAQRQCPLAADWALTREPRKERATVVAKNSMGVDS
jgi:hypothetical protein